MSTLKIDIKYDDKKIQKAIARLVKSGSNLEPVFNSIGEYLIPEHEQRWEQGVDSNGSPWKDLDAKTWAKKRTNKMLYEEGDLLRGPVYHADRDSLEFGITDFKAPFFQFGTINMPARELLGINDADEREILDLMQDFISDAWNE